MADLNYEAFLGDRRATELVNAVPDEELQVWFRNRQRAIADGLAGLGLVGP